MSSIRNCSNKVVGRAVLMKTSNIYKGCTVRGELRAKLKIARLQGSSWLQDEAVSVESGKLCSYCS